MNILITGGAGYIGSVLVPTLLEQDFKITVLDNFYYHQEKKHLLNNAGIKLVEGDVRDYSLVKNLLKENDVIIPLAALVGAPICDQKPKEATEINLESIKFLKKNASKSQMFLMPVSNSGYGIGEKGSVCDENSPLKPISLYGKTKVAAEEIIMERSNSISFRLATVFGMSKRMRLDLLVNYFVNKALTEKKIKIFEGHFKRNYVHINDVSRVFLYAINNFSEMKNEVYNFGLENANLSKIELAEKIKSLVNDFEILEDKFGEDPDKRDYIVSNKKILSKKFEFLNDLDQGLKELIDGIPKLAKGKHSNV